MDIKDYRKAIRALLKESKEEKAALSEGRVITRKLKSGEPCKGGDSALERVSGKTGHSKPDDAKVKPHVTKSSYKKRRQSKAEWSIKGDKWHRGEDTKKQVATDARPKPNRHQRKRMMKEAFSILEKVTGHQKDAGSDAAQAERDRQVKAGKKVDPKKIEKVRRRAASRQAPGFKNPVGGEIVRSAPPTVGEVGRSKPGSEHRGRQAARRKKYQDETTPKKKLP
jgi:hypothetical protein